jgi:hypothetical protein
MNVNVTPLPTPPPAAPVEPKRRTITLTNRAPIQIVEDEWPIIAEGQSGWDHPCGEGLGWLAQLRVRKGQYRYIIHGNYDYSTENSEDDQRVRVGRVISDSDAARDLWKHMLEVGEEMRSRVENEKLRVYVTYALDNCFASLKPLTY